MMHGSYISAVEKSDFTFVTVQRNIVIVVDVRKVRAKLRYPLNILLHEIKNWSMLVQNIFLRSFSHTILFSSNSPIKIFCLILIQFCVLVSLLPRVVFPGCRKPYPPQNPVSPHKELGSQAASLWSHGVSVVLGQACLCSQGALAATGLSAGDALAELAADTCVLLGETSDLLKKERNKEVPGPVFYLWCEDHTKLAGRDWHTDLLVHKAELPVGALCLSHRRLRDEQYTPFYALLF